MKPDIKAIVADVDGVLVGLEGGVNFPAPGVKIINALKEINGKGIPVILCTGRPFYTPAMKMIIESADLDNFHIGDMGGLTMNPLTAKIFDSRVIDRNDCLAMIELLLGARIYFNIFTPDNYLVQKNCIDKTITWPIAKAIATDPFVVESLKEAILSTQVLRFMAVAKNEQDKSKIIEITSPFLNKINLLWGNNPSVPLLHLADMPVAGNSKSAALKKLLEHLKITFKNVLGVGDGNIDWDFMKLCGYRATLENALPEVKQNVAAGDSTHNFIAPHVDQNGILEAFKHFQLLD